METQGTPMVEPDAGMTEPPDSEDVAEPEPDGLDDADLVGRLRGTGPGPGEAELSVIELEALLFVAERPLTRREIAGLAGVDTEAVDARLGDLEVELRQRGVRLLAVGDRVELATAPEAGSIIARYTGAEGLKLSPAALEALAIVAYRQPATRGVVERIRGVDSDSVMRNLLHRRLIVEQGRADTPGRPILYGTGFEFLERFGLTSLDDLPALDAETAQRLADVGVVGGETVEPLTLGIDTADDGDAAGDA
jgi:segregation and condensation protein B